MIHKIYNNLLKNISKYLIKKYHNILNKFLFNYLIFEIILTNYTKIKIKNNRICFLHLHERI